MKTRRLMCAGLFLLITLFSNLAMAGIIKGSIVDKRTNEPLIGASVLVRETSTGVVTNLDGEFVLPNTPKGTYTIEARYIGYQTILLKSIKVDGNVPLVLHLQMEDESIQLAGAVIVAKKNRASALILQAERKLSTTAVENLGAKEMRLKGISNVANGVKKMTSISFERSGQLIVRGLGDRYSTTTLNGLPIASPNPDNKLIPLYLFPTSTVQNVTVSKVYEAGAFADYSGAHIDISTRENIGADFFTLSIKTGGQLGTAFSNFYSADKGNTSFLKANKISNTIKNLSTDYNNNKWDEYIRYNDPFKSSFSINQQKALPNFGASLGWGKTYTLKNDHKLNLLFSVSANHTNESKEDAYVARLKANGTPLNEFTYDSYTSKLTMAGLLSVGYTLANNDAINYTLFFARNAIDDYKMREGQDAEEVQLVGSNSVAHIYTLFNNQLAGKHKLGDNLTLNWKGSYSSTSSDEPDRRQVMYEKQEGTSDLRLFTFNSGTMRYFGELTEKEAVGDVRMTYRPKAEGKTRIHFGGTYKNKRRDYSSIAFFYDLQHYKNNSIQNIYQIGSLINREQIENGQITIQKYFQPRQSYYAGMDIAAGFIETDYALNDAWLINLGLRYEHVNQWVKYWNDGGTGKRSSIQTGDLFPALNIKYSRNQSNIFRLSLSRTITRPSFIEMAPFLYSESYGSAEIRGNDQLKNAYNYNADLRYEFYPKNSHDLFSITLYYKYLDKPIEQVQEYSGGSPQQTFYNADKGMAAGVEMEYRKEISKNLQLTMNGSYMYTNVDLPSSGGGNYTEAERELQGASPYLGNADLVYSLPCKKEQSTLNFALIYNVQGPRIHSVGTNGAGDVKQEAYHTLNFVSNYTLQKHWSFKIEINNLLNSTVHFKQTVLQSGLPNKKIDSEYYKNGTAIELGMNYKF